MKKTLAAITLAGLVSACATPEQIAQASKQQCDLLGYAKNDPRYVECVERGFRGQVAAQDQAAEALTTYLILEAIF